MITPDKRRSICEPFRLTAERPFNNLVYGSYAPGAPNLFIDDAQWKNIWLGPERCYLVASDFALPRLEKLVGRALLYVVVRAKSYCRISRPDHR